MTPEKLDEYGPLVAHLGEVLAKSVIFWKTRGMRKRDRVRLPALRKIISTIQQRHNEAKQHELEHYQRVYNVVLFVLLIDHDIAVLSRYFALGYRTWERKFAARQLAVLLYEVSKDLPELLGGEFRKSLMTLPLRDGAKLELNHITKLLDEFKSKNGPFLKAIRLLVGAHRDHDAAKQLEVIEAIDPLSVYKMAADFYDCINPLISFLAKTTELMTNPHTTMNHLLETPEFRALSSSNVLPHSNRP